MKALIFDVNGVLTDDLTIHVDVYDQVFRRYGITNGGQLIRENIYLSTKGKVEFVLKENGRADLSADSLVKEKAELFEQTIEGRDILFPEVREVIPKLAGKYILGIVTSQIRRQLEASFPLEVLKYFPVIITQEDAKRPKPDPESLLLAARRLSLEPRDCGYIGDTSEDIEAAHRAGMYAIGITTGFHTEQDLRQANLVIKSLKDLLSI